MLAGLRARQLAVARVLIGLALAAVAARAALVTLTARTGIGHPGRWWPERSMFAVIYLAVGALAARGLPARSTAQC